MIKRVAEEGAKLFHGIQHEDGAACASSVNGIKGSGLAEISSTLRHFYTLFTPQPDIFTSTLHANRNTIRHVKRLWRCTVSITVMTGIVLVFMLLGYLIYALINAETF
ncbi:K+-transporting ATPase ATPase F chain [Erwinia amylovora MR1]|nr:K+-transporting ATPase ATPase F chain [Erwinia amylovora MR1]